MITITSLKELDELIAKELGYIFHKEEFIYFEEKFTNSFWLPPNTSLKDYSNYIHEVVRNSWSIDYQIPCPAFSSNLNDSQLLVNHIHSLDLDLNIESNKFYCSVRIEKVDRDEPETLDWWESTCGEAICCLKYSTINSSINSFPLALCLAFLKYKNIEIQLNLND